MTFTASASPYSYKALTGRISKPGKPVNFDQTSLKKDFINSENSSTIEFKIITSSISTEILPMLTPIDSPNKIDLELDAMTPEEYFAAFLSTAGAWADMENLSDEGFTDMEWGFIDDLESDDPNAQPISP